MFSVSVHYEMCFAGLSHIPISFLICFISLMTLIPVKTPFCWWTAKSTFPANYTTQSDGRVRHCFNVEGSACRYALAITQGCHAAAFFTMLACRCCEKAASFTFKTKHEIVRYIFFNASETARMFISFIYFTAHIKNVSLLCARPSNFCSLACHKLSGAIFNSHPILSLSAGK